MTPIVPTSVPNNSARLATASQGNATHAGHEYATNQTPPSPDTTRAPNSGRTGGRDEVVTAIGSALGAVLDCELPEITESTSLFEIGLDSTSVLELLLELEEDLAWEFDAENLRMGHVETVGALADFVSSTLDT